MAERRYRLLVVTVWALLSLSCVEGGTTGGTQNYPSNSPSTPIDQGPALELLAVHRERAYDYLTTKGRVRNLTSQQLSDVMVQVEYYDVTDKMVTTQEGVLDYRPLMPGQISPFTVMLHDDPAVYTCRVKFKHRSGEIIPHKDSADSETPKARRGRRARS